MNWLQKILENKSLQVKLYHFLNLYGISGLEQALQIYSDLQQEYICNTKAGKSKLKIRDIYYLKIHGHHIVVHTEKEVFQKYGSLSGELKTLSRYGFVKCSQNCIVSLTKVKAICNNEIILNNHETVHMSRNYAPRVMMSFHNVLHG